MLLWTKHLELKLKVCRPVTSVPTNQTASVLLSSAKISHNLTYFCVVCNLIAILCIWHWIFQAMFFFFFFIYFIYCSPSAKLKKIKIKENNRFLMFGERPTSVFVQAEGSWENIQHSHFLCSDRLSEKWVQIYN